MKNYNISDSEWEVMKVLWNTPNITLKEIGGMLKDCSWSYSTVRTLVTRLMKKNVIDADKTGSNFKYYPLVKEDVCKKEEVRNFMGKIFDGSVSMLVSALVKDSNITQKEYGELMNIIDKIEEGE